MRPERLEMVGFAPFLERTEIDFDDAELFALTGATGAGKSSVIDAIVFALYGSVPRYGKKGVSPIISLRASEAKVKFHFTVDGNRYVVARVARRNPGGGAKTDARLESMDRVLGSGAPQVTQAVEELLGLSIDHFTRSVVLPQGEFAAFLHDPPAAQQALVKALLDMGVLDRVRQLATGRAQTAAALVGQAAVQLDQLADATPQAEEAARLRVRTLERLGPPVAEAESVIRETSELIEARQRTLAELSQRQELLASVARPDGVFELSERLVGLTARQKEAGAEIEAAEKELADLEAKAAEIPGRSELETAVGLHERLEAARQKQGAIDLQALTTEAKEARAAVDGFRQSHAEAVAEWEAARTRHAAHALTEGLAAGDPCPVCEQPLSRDPVAPPADLEERRQTADAAAKALEEATRAQQQADLAEAEARARHEAAAAAVAEAEEAVAGIPPGPELVSLLTARAEIDEMLATSTNRLKAAREAEKAARDEIETLREAEDRAWTEFAATRDRLAALEPPPPPRDDLAGAWAELTDWIRHLTENMADQVVEAEAAVQEAGDALDKHRDELERLLSEAEVEGDGPASARLAAALATAQAELTRVVERCQQRQTLEADRQRLSEEEAVASVLSKHLFAPNFEGWLLAEALATLVQGANELLDQLTDGAYALDIDDRLIEVVDHRNAGQRRPVRSLSGGETFLVSLALALSLGAQLATLSERGGARLESIFLDEGFGSLDAETLETVTAVVSELAAQGRTVGVVTHVKELAEQMPVRFEVVTGPQGSTVSRSGAV